MPWGGSPWGGKPWGGASGSAPPSATLSASLSLTANGGVAVHGTATLSAAFALTASAQVTYNTATLAATFTLAATATVTGVAPGGLLVRERPPTDLAATITTPNGVTYRWGADDPNVNNKPDAITFATAMPGGFDTCSLTLNRDPRITWPDLVELSTVTINGLGGSQVAYQGRLEGYPSQAGSESQFTPSISGWQNHLQDDQAATVIFIDRELANWVGPTTSRQLQMINAGYQPSGALSYQVGADPNNKIALIFSGTTPWSGEQLAEAWYGNGGPLLARIQASALSQLNATYALDTDGTLNANDSLNVLFSKDTVGSVYNGPIHVTAGGTLVVTGSPDEPFALIQLGNVAGATGTPPAGTTVGVAIENLAVIGNHGLTLQTGASGTSPSYDDGFLSSDIEAYVLSTWCPKLAFTTGPGGSIQPSSFVIPQLAYPTATTPDAIITAATQFELRDWAVWEATTGTSGPTYYSNARGARGKQWVARVGPAQLQNAGPQISQLWNGVVVAWQNVDGTTGIVGPPGSGAPNTSSALVDSDPTNPANILGINRWYLLTLGTSTLAGATQVGTIFLQEQALINTSGQAQLVGHVQDSGGVYWPSWAVRAGDSIAFVDAALTAPRRVVSTSYVHTSRTNTVTLDAPPDGLEALMARMSAAISFTGFQ